MKKALFFGSALLSLALLSLPAAAQPVSATVVATCGSQSLSAGTNRAVSQNTVGNACVNVTGTITPSGTQDVNIVQTGGVTQLRGAGAVGTGSERIAVAQDTTTIAGSAPGTAGTPSANVVSVQGVSGGTALPASQSGTWTVQPGNTPNTTPWLVTETASTAQQTTPAQQGSAASSLVICAAACNLWDASVTIGATSGYLMIHNATSAPSDGAVTPRVCLPVISNGTNGALALAWTAPKYFSTGATAVFSTTGCFTQTGATAVFMSGDAK